MLHVASCGILMGMFLAIPIRVSCPLATVTMRFAFGLMPYIIREDHRIMPGSDSAKTPRDLVGMLVDTNFDQVLRFFAAVGAARSSARGL